MEIRMNNVELTVGRAIFYGTVVTCALCLALCFFGLSIELALLISWLASSVIIPATAWAAVFGQRHIGALNPKRPQVVKHLRQMDGGPLIDQNGNRLHQS